MALFFTKRPFTLIVLLCYLPLANAFFLWGARPPNQIGLGYEVLHWTDVYNHHPIGRVFFPDVSVTYRTVYAGMFINTLHKATVSVGVDRVLFSAVHHWRYAFGYKLGMLFGGYCFMDLYCERNARIPVMPGFQLYGDVGLKNNFFELSWVGTVSTLAFKHVF